jgi:cbb3-type cytochrome oxidase maturation protein
MEVLIYLVPLALALGLLGLAAFLWTLKSGQYDDLDGAGWRAILDDEDPENLAHAEPQTRLPSPLAGEDGGSE